MRCFYAQKEFRAISVAENPSANPRVDSICLSHLIEERVGLAAIPHITCRDRNRIGMQSSLMGANKLGLRTVLAITGDGVNRGDLHANGHQVSFVSDLKNSFELITLIRQLNEGRDQLNRPLKGRTDFLIGVGVNPNVRHFDKEAKRLRDKVDLGAHFAMSQVIFRQEAIKNLYSGTHDLGIPILAGLLPLLSFKNAQFLQRLFEIPVVVMNRLATAHDPAAARAEGVEICKELIPTILKAGAPGFYLICPRGRVELILELICFIRSQLRSRMATLHPSPSSQTLAPTGTDGVLV